jgi:coenzyme F420 hydrogenase subunit beta
MIENTIISVVNDGLCTGCGTCYSLCPNDAIKIEIENKRGIYLPYLDSERCNACGICLKACPGHEVDFKSLNMNIFGKKPNNKLIGNYINCYFGHSTDYSIQYNCASGGLITQLLIFALDEGIIDGALVTKMKIDKPFEPEPFIARTRDEIIEASKSKYCPVPANIALKEILNKDGRYAVVGLPCHIHGVIKAENISSKLKQRIVMHLGLWCSTTCNFYATESVLKKYDINKIDVNRIEYRGEGWPGGMSVYHLDGKETFIPLDKYWDMNFASFSPSRCRLCCDASAELSDISFGDYRGRDMFLIEKIGQSGIISRTNFSENILNKMLLKQKVKISKISVTDLAANQGYFSSKKNILSRFHIRRLFGEKIPTYYNDFPSPIISSYILEILLNYPLAYFASKKYLWKLLYIYTSIFNKILSLLSYVQNILKK